MKNKFIKGLVVSFALAVSGFANAGLITITDSQDITITGQAFEFNFDKLHSNIVGDITFFLNVSGDFSDNFSDEWISIAFDGYAGELVMDESGVLTPLNGLLLQSFSSINVVDFFDETFSASFKVENILANFLTTNSITINTQNGPSVNSYGADGYSGSDKDFVQIGFTYQIHDVPEPSTLAVFALGLMGLASRKFKKQA